MKLVGSGFGNPLHLGTNFLFDFEPFHFWVGRLFLLDGTLVYHGCNIGVP